MFHVNDLNVDTKSANWNGDSTDSSEFGVGVQKIQDFIVQAKYK